MGQPQLDGLFPEFGKSHFQIKYSNKIGFPDDPDAEGAHIHGCYEIYLNLSGDVSFLVGRNVYGIKPGDVVFTAPGDLHYCLYHSVSVHEHYCMWFDVPEDSPARGYLERHRPPGHLRLPAEQRERLTEAVRELYERREDGGFETTLSFLRILDQMNAGREVPESAEMGAELPDALRRMIADLDEHYAEIRHVREIAERNYVSVSTMNALFRRYIGLTPHHYLESRKLAEAERLLRSGENVTEACYGAGFEDCSHFILLFRKKYGETPKQYQKGL